MAGSHSRRSLCWPRCLRQSCCTAIISMRRGRCLIALLAVAAVIGVIVPRPRVIAAGVTIGALAGLAGTTTVSVLTAATPHHGVDTGGGEPRVPRTRGRQDANAELAGLLAATHTPWSAATNGSQSAAALEVVSGTSVMAVGGWSADPVPDLQQFIDDVHAGKVSYYVEAGRSAAAGGCTARSSEGRTTAPRTPVRSPTGWQRTTRAPRSVDRRFTA